MKAYPHINAQAIASFPKQIQPIVQAIVDSDPTAQFFYRVDQSAYSTTVFIIENNEREEYSVCHCFQADTVGSAAWDYSYESMSLQNILHFERLAQVVNLAL